MLVRCVVPRPIAFVSTLGLDGHANLAPFSFFTLGGSNPPTLVFCPALDNDGQEKDTLRNIRETGEFVVNLVTKEMAEHMNETSAILPKDHSEWPLTDFTKEPSTVIKPDRVAESPVQMECKLLQVVEHGNGAGSTRFVIGEILCIHVQDDLIKDGFMQEFQPIARLGGAHYLDMESLTTFEMIRPSIKPSVEK